jgi:protein TonB
MKAIPSDLDEIVFRNKNKLYGSYVLRKLAPTRSRNAFLIGLAAMVSLMILPLIASQTGVDFPDKVFVSNEDVVLKDPPPIDEEKELPEALVVPPPPPPKRDEIKFVPPQIVADGEAPPERTIATIETLDSAQVSTKDVKGAPDAPEQVDFVPTAARPNDEIQVAESAPDPDPAAFVPVDKQPVPVNLNEIRRQIKYPSLAKEGNIQGKVLIKILIDKEGNPVKHHVVRSPHDLLAEACVNQIYKLKFTPGIQSQKPVKVWVQIPFDFKIGQ